MKILAALALLVLPAILQGQGTAPAQLRQLFADEWEHTLRENPTFATSVGDRRFDNRLSSVGLADQQRRLAAEREFLRRLRAIDRAALSRGDQLNYDIFLRLKQDEIAQYEHRSYLIPITNREGFHTSFPQLPDRVPLATVRDYESYIARLRAFRTYAQQHIELMREGIRTGMVLPRVSVQGLPEMLQAHVVDDPSTSLLYAPFREFPAGVAQAEQERLRAGGRAAISESVVPGYRDFLAFITQEYTPRARPSIGASELPNGRAIYTQRVRQFTTLDLTPEQVHQTGLAEVSRIRAEM
nr:DUF885 domain-containing protein [Gemmatimonadota bacterium]